jgi:uncharacterized protein YjbI with pentapeptide repeats
VTSRQILLASQILLSFCCVLVAAAVVLPDRYNEFDQALLAGGGVLAAGGFGLLGLWLTQKWSLQTQLGAGQEFPGMDLTGRDLSGFSLPGKNFTGAYFVKANLRGARLHGANLTHAWFNDADLRGTRFDAIELFPSNTLMPSETLTPGSIQPEADMNGAHLCGAKYDDDTQWPSNMNPDTTCAIKVKRPWWRRMFGA